MLKQLSHYTDGQLEYLLARVREIAALGDEAALIETDKLVWEIMGDEEEGGSYVASLSPPGESAPQPQGGVHDPSGYGDYARLSRIGSSHERFKRYIQGGILNQWIILQFERNINGVDDYGVLVDTEDEHWARLMSECQESIDQAWEVLLRKTLGGCSARTFKNIASVASMMTDLEQIVEGYTQRHVLTDEMKQMIHTAKERGARFRWGKKTADADVAEKAGYVGKAVGLRREAEALLGQDWAMVFGGEEPPKREAVTEEDSDVEDLALNEANTDGGDVVMPGHEPEIMLTTVYCPDCNMTYELESASYPGGRESAPLTCPDCEKLLGGTFESGWTVEKRTEGDTRKKWSVGPPRRF